MGAWVQAGHSALPRRRYSSCGGLLLARSTPACAAPAPRASSQPCYCALPSPPCPAQDTFLPIMWVEISSQANPGQLRQVAPLLWARAAQRFLRVHAHLAAAALATVALLCLSLAAVLWQGSAAGAVEVGAAGGSGGSGSGRMEAAERAEQREPLLPRSFPVAPAAEEDGPAADVEQQANGAADDAPKQQSQGPGLVGALLQRLRGSSAAAEAPPAAA